MFIQEFQFFPQNYKYDQAFLQTIETLATRSESIIIKCSIEGVINYISKNIESILGYQPEEMLGNRLVDYFHEKDYQVVNQRFRDIVKNTNTNDKYITRIIKKDQSYVWFELSIHLLYETDIKKSSEVLAIMNEIPVENEDKLLQDNKLSAIGQLAAGIAHEIRNPLTSLKGFIQLMKSDKKFNEQYLQIMENEINQIESISKELMILGKPNESNYQTYDLKEIFNNCKTLLEGIVFQKRINIIQNSIEDSILVLCDEQKIKQVIINLVKNALDAMEKPGKLTIHLKKQDQYGVISITDEGIGISEDLLHKLGQPFLTTKSHGNGLGLMMCYKIVEEHNGKIEVQSEVGVGTTFTVYLPLDPEQK